MIGETRFTTINTDAGVKDGKAAIAYWIRSNSKWLTGSRALKTPDLSSNEAELIGIVIALYYACLDSYLSTADIIVVNCDNQDALRRMKTQQVPDNLKSYLEKIHSIIPKNKIRYKWVKGHSKSDKSRNWVNNWCDKEARKHYKLKNNHEKVNSSAPSAGSSTN